MCPGQTNQGTRGATSANAWPFPLLRYDLYRRRVSPFVDIGTTLRRLGPLLAKVCNSWVSNQNPYRYHATPGGNPEIAITAGAGIRTRVSLFNFSSEVRFLHWTTGYFVPARNQAVLIVSVTFPAKAQLSFIDRPGLQKTCCAASAPITLYGPGPLRRTRICS